MIKWNSLDTLHIFLLDYQELIGLKLSHKFGFILKKSNYKFFEMKIFE